jgi:deoxycytidylate deaminase
MSGEHGDTPLAGRTPRSEQSEEQPVSPEGAESSTGGNGDASPNGAITADTAHPPLDGDDVNANPAIEEDVELVIGITRAMGAPVGLAMEQLANSLSNYGYEIYNVKISDLIRDSLVAREEWPDQLTPHDRYELLIKHGNALCKEAGRLDELALRAVDSIREHREALLRPADDVFETDVAVLSVVTQHAIEPGTEAVQERWQEPSADEAVSHGEDDERADRPLAELAVPAKGQHGAADAKAAESAARILSGRRVYIVDSLKRIEEVGRLRQIYGDHFLLIGFQASEESRLKHLTSKFETRGVVSTDEAARTAQVLMDKDGAQPVDFGQELLRTFPMADVFIDVERNGKARAQVIRTVELLFGDPAASGPTNAEFAMQLATQTQTRSPELGLRVGAVILSERGDVLAAGTNQHPTEKGAPSHDAGAVDLRHLVADTMRSLASVESVLHPNCKERALTEPEALADELLAGPLKGGELTGLIEYQRPVHAEMNALISALRQQASLEGATIYVTAYPCHICAKHLIAVGLDVVYLSPYAKSKATAMYGRQTRNFKPFTGVAPRRYEEFFIAARAADRKDEHGERQEWDATKKQGETPKVTPQISMRSKQNREDLGRA